MGNKSTGKLAVVEYSDDSGATWVKIGCWVNFQPPGDEDDIIDFSCLDETDPDFRPGDSQQSTAEGEITWIVGDGTVVPAAGVQPDPDAFLKARYDDKATLDWRITHPNWDRDYEFSGKVFRYAPNAISRADRMSAQVGITRIGAITRS